MPPTESEALVVRRQLERILQSPGFARNERLSRFLRFVVEEHLDGKDHELKESVIAVEVFRRRPDFDSRLDPVVRTEAIRLRVRLRDYYLKDGKADELVIELPKGGYVPRFREIAETQPFTVPSSIVTARYGTRLRIALGLAGLVIALAGVAWWWAQHRRRSRLYRLRTPAMIPPTNTSPTALPMNSFAICPSSTA
jgi:hypothetical protein